MEWSHDQILQLIFDVIEQLLGPLLQEKYCEVMVFTTKWIENQTYSDFQFWIVTWCDFSLKQID